MTATIPVRPAATYVYLAAFFALLSGVFHPFVMGSNLALVAVGVAVLFAGLAGGVLLYRAAASRRSPGTFVSFDFNLLIYRTGTWDRRRWAYLVCGFALVAVSLVFIYQLTGRI